jgi:preprotein translocase subunit SecE
MAMMETINVVYVKNWNQKNQLVLDMFVVFAMLFLMFPEILKITWPPMTQSEYCCQL